MLLTIFIIELWSAWHHDTSFDKVKKYIKDVQSHINFWKSIRIFLTLYHDILVIIRWQNLYLVATHFMYSPFSSVQYMVDILRALIHWFFFCVEGDSRKKIAHYHIITCNQTLSLRAPAWEHWESCDSDYFGTLFIIRLKIPFGELFSKIIILSSSVFLFSKKFQKFENAVKVHFPPNGMAQITRKDEAFVKSWNLINYC